MKYFLPTLLLLLALSACKTKQNTTNPKQDKPAKECTHTGTVKDFTGLDGCKLLIVTDDGKKLLPQSISDSRFVLKAKQRIKFSYEEVTDAISICMTEDAIVKITCIELTEDRPVRPECVKANNLEGAVWMGKAMQKHQALKVLRYDYLDDGWAYFFQNVKHGFLYDCQGTFLCEVEKNRIDQCKSPVKNPKGGVVIWESRDR